MFTRLLRKLKKLKRKIAAKYRGDSEELPPSDTDLPDKAGKDADS
jgi:hypothetical protein